MFNVLFEHNFQGKASPVCEQKLCSHEFVERKAHWGGNIAQLVRALDRHAAYTGLFGAARDFSPESAFSADSLMCVRTPLCAITCFNICAHIKDHVVHVRVWWIMETLKHPACTVGWVV